MSKSARYIKIVEWSDEDECFIGYCRESLDPVVTETTRLKFIGNCVKLFDELLEHAQKKNRTLPRPTIGRDLENF